MGYDLETVHFLWILSQLVHPILPDLAKNIYFGNSLLSSSDINATDAGDFNPFDFAIYIKKNIFLPKYL